MNIILKLGTRELQKGNSEWQCHQKTKENPGLPSDRTITYDRGNGYQGAIIKE